MSRFSLPSDVIWILESLESEGYRADIVGGPVRDLLRGTEPHDFDITTSALPEETKAVFSGERIIETGIKHGTVSLIKNGEQYEITTYRIDGEYEDSRHPKSVQFTRLIEEDLARRDFTVNAITYSDRHGITDPFGGREDIEKKIIRAVGNAEKRFDEDALRIIRGIRFASTLGFRIESETKTAMLKKSPLLLNISKERIFTEWKKLLEGALALEIIAEYKPVIDTFLPEVKIPEKINREAFLSASPEARHISLLASVSAVEYSAAMRRLKTDNVTVKSGSAVISAIGKYDRDVTSAAFMLRDLGAENARLLRECEAILGIAENIDLSDIETVEKRGLPYRLSDLAVNGNDLIALGFAGAEIKTRLLSLQSRVLRGELPNDKSALLAALN